MTEQPMQEPAAVTPGRMAERPDLTSPLTSPRRMPPHPEPHRQLADAIVRSRDGRAEIQLGPIDRGRVTVFMSDDAARADGHNSAVARPASDAAVPAPLPGQAVARPVLQLPSDAVISANRTSPDAVPQNPAPEMAGTADTASAWVRGHALPTTPDPAAPPSRDARAQPDRDGPELDQPHMTEHPMQEPAAVTPGRMAERHDLTSPLTSSRRMPPHPEPHRQLADAIVRSRDGRVEILLDPIELGRVTVVMGQDDASRIGIVAERPETLDLMKRHSDQLLRDLRDSGMPDARLDFMRQDGGKGRGGQPDLPSPARRALGTEDDVPPPPPPRGVTGTNRIDIRL